MFIYYMKKILLYFFVGIVFAGLFSFGYYVLAVPPASPYAPGYTAEPNCIAGSTNCTVSAPVPYNGATSSLNLGSNNFTVNGTGKFGFDASNYSTLSTDKNGNLTIATKSSGGQGSINLNSAMTGDATILSNNGTLVLGATGGLNNENITFDFETYKDKIALNSSSGVLALDLGSLNIVTNGNLTLGQSTPGTLATRIKNGAPTEADENGALVVDSTNGRLYFRYGGEWHYIAQTAGFQIPSYETKDPVSNEQIKNGDMVLGMINETLPDGALHGVWVKATSALASLGIIFKNGVTHISNLVVDTFTAKTAKIDSLEMNDRATGVLYCVFIENGSWHREKGPCPVK